MWDVFVVRARGAGRKDGDGKVEVQRHDVQGGNETSLQNVSEPYHTGMGRLVTCKRYLCYDASSPNIGCGCVSQCTSVCNCLAFTVDRSRG